MDKKETVNALKREVSILRRKIAELEESTCGREGSEKGPQDASERALKEVARYKDIIAAIGDPVAIYDTEFRVLYQNRPHRELVGDHVGEYCYKAYKKIDFICEGCAVAMSFSDGEVHAVAKSTAVNGKTLTVEITGSLLRDAEGKIIAGIEVVRDITQARLREEELEKYRDGLEELVMERTSELMSANERLQREVADRKRMQEDLIRTEKLESLGVLAGGIAHDFNNLLSAVMGNISLAKRYVTPTDKIFVWLDEAERASSRAGDLAQQLLTFSKAGAPVKKMTSLSGLVRESAEFALRGSRARCDFRAPADLWKAEVDEGQICQVINNIVLNAGQAMPLGGTIRVECGNVKLGPTDLPGIRSGGYVRIDVQDSGCGIAEEHVERIFDPYFTTKERGSGLGLATAYSIISKHDGAVTVDSTPGEGTVFHIYLPAVACYAEDTPSPAVERARRLYAGSGRVLVLDDEEIIRMIVGSMLKEIGYEPSFVEDGKAAIQAYAEGKAEGRPFDAVILDLTIKGGMGGMECMENLLRIDPDVKAVVSSGYAEDPIMSNYREFGFRGVITKPYQIEDLSEILFRVLGRK
jgi:signal transduction histidine kinase/ActR/RegA family two-component response regulator